MNAPDSQTFFGRSLDFKQLGDELHQLCTDLYPICRSITGPGVRETLQLLSEHVPVRISEIASGTKVFDWTIPREWRCRAAYIEDLQGTRLVDFEDHSLHVMNYSVAVDAEVTRAELDAHLHSLPGQPNLIPYRTSYYDDNWGFCLSERQRDSLGEGPFRVRIDSDHIEGSLTYGEFFLQGRTDQEILISTHVCHPSLANDNLSGISVATLLARILSQAEALHYSARFVFIPATIGAIAWLSNNQDRWEKIVGGVVLSGVGDAGPLTYKSSRRGDGLIDGVLPRYMSQLGAKHELRDYTPYGYDERQFCSLGPNLPVGCLMRTPFGEYPEYHTSGDNLDFIHAERLAETLHVLAGAIQHSQFVRTYENLAPNCEPQLGRRGLYAAIGGDNDQKLSQMALLWMLSDSDGKTSTYDIHNRSGLPLDELCLAAERLEENHLLRRCESTCGPTGMNAGSRHASRIVS